MKHDLFGYAIVRERAPGVDVAPIVGPGTIGDHSYPTPAGIRRGVRSCASIAAGDLELVFGQRFLQLEGKTGIEILQALDVGHSVSDSPRQLQSIAVRAGSGLAVFDDLDIALARSEGVDRTAFHVVGKTTQPVAIRRALFFLVAARPRPDHSPSAVEKALPRREEALGRPIDHLSLPQVHPAIELGVPKRLPLQD